MLEYRNLSPLEFEYVCQDVMQAKLGTALRRFPAGRDDGIDLIDDLETNHIVVQVKHYWKSSFSALKQALKAERAKVDRLSPGQYYLCCGQTLSPNQTRELYELFSDYMTSEQNILTLLELDEFLTAPQNVGLLRKHFKLWLSASSILSELYNQEIFIDSETLLYDVADELPYDLSLVIQRVEFFILISGQAVIEPDFHDRSFPLWCADLPRHTIAHKFLNSYQNKSGHFIFYLTNRISRLICVGIIHRQIIVDHHFQEVIELVIRPHIGIHDTFDVGFFFLSTHSVPFPRNQFGQ